MGAERNGNSACGAPAGGPRWLLGVTSRLAGLSALVLAWPLLDVLRRDAAFFAVRRSHPVDIASLLAVALLGPPLAAAVVLALARGLGRRVAGAVAGLMVAALVALGLWRPIADGFAGPRPGAAIAVGAGLALALAAARSAAVRSLLGVLAAAPLVVAAVFLADGNVRKLLRPAGPVTLPQVASASRTPLVMLVLDELPTGSLMDGAGAVDRRLFPNFAALADTSTWFRNASTVHTNTVYVVPALLTGLWPDDASLLPVHADHPRNLFTILAGSHRMRVMETVTNLCPPELLVRGSAASGTDGGAGRGAAPSAAGGRSRPSTGPPGVGTAASPDAGFAGRMAALLADVAVVEGHVLLPRAWAARLPDVTTNWGGFLDGGFGLASPGAAADPNAGAPAGEEAGAGGRGAGTLAAAAMRGELVEASQEDRAAIFEAFIDSIDGPGGPDLYFLHVLLPHYPWTTLPSGRAYPGATRAIGFTSGAWLPDEWVMAQALQRHLLQLGNVDRLLGRLMARCRETGVWDDALVVVVADHGAGFRAGAHRRHAGEDNWEDLFWAPLLVKRPGQREAVVDDRPVESVDVLPTILDALGVEVPWPLDGASAFAQRPPPRPARRLAVLRGGTMEVPNGPPDPPWPVAGLKQRLFGDGAGWDAVYALATRPDLLGRRVADLPAGPPADLDVQIETGDLFGAVDKGSGLVPAMVRGVVSERGRPASGGADGPAPALDLAVALDGTIRAVTKTHAPRPGERAFVAMVSDELLRDGANRIEVHVVTGEDGRPRLSPVGFAAYTLEETAGGAILRGSDGRDLPVVAGALDGQVDQAGRFFNDLRLMGWAADAVHDRPVDAVIVLRDGRSVFRGTTGVTRSGGASDREGGGPKDELYASSGFRIDIPWSVLGKAASGHLRVFAQRGDLASELPVSRAAKWIGRVQHHREGDELLGADGTRLPITGAGLAGKLDQALTEDGQLALLGWAVDLQRSAPVEQVLVLADDRQVEGGAPWLDRHDVAGLHGDGARTSGFHFWMPLAWFGEPPAERVEVYAVSGGRALRLDAGPLAAWLEQGLASAPGEPASADGGGR